MHKLLERQLERQRRLAVEPSARFRSAGELSDELERIALQVQCRWRELRPTSVADTQNT